MSKDGLRGFQPLVGFVAEENLEPSTPKSRKRSNSQSVNSQSQIFMPKFRKEDITVEDLKRAKDVFDNTPGGQLNQQQFLTEFGPILAGTMNKEELQLWFMRIDASDNQMIDWNEFSDFLLLSGDCTTQQLTGVGTADSEAQVFVKQIQAVSVPPTECSATGVSGYNHSEIITNILPHPRGHKYFTSSQDGTVRLWDSQTLEFDQVFHNGKYWVTTMCLARNDKKLVVASVDRLISIYDLRSEKLTAVFGGNTTATGKYSMSWNRPLSKAEIDTRHVSTAQSKFDGKESIETFRLRQERIRLTHGPRPQVEVNILRQMDFPAMCMLPGLPNLCYDHLIVGMSNGHVQAYDILGSSSQEVSDPSFDLCVHKGPVTTLQWMTGYDQFFTTGSDGAIFQTNLHKMKVTRLGEKAGEKFVHGHPIHSSAWIEQVRLLATCGTERHVSLWSPSTTTPPIYLHGHLVPVTHVTTCEDENLLISLDADKTLKVWDMRTLRPLQSTVDYDEYRPQNRLTGLMYDSKHRCLVTGCAAPVAWPLSKILVPIPDPLYNGHQKPVVAIAFNKIFKQIATADADFIKLWNMNTGVLESTLTVDSLRSTSINVRAHDEGIFCIYALKFDFSGKRLLIALTNGTVMVCNYANAQLLTEFIPKKGRSSKREEPHAEATSLSYYQCGNRKYIVVVKGSNLLVWEDKAENSHEEFIDQVFILTIDRSVYLRLRWSKTMNDLEMFDKWKSPLPTVVEGMPPHHLLVGTDGGLISVFSSISFELVSIIGNYEPGISITCIAYNEKRELIFSGRSDGKIQIQNFDYKDRIAYIVLRDNMGRLPNPTSIDAGRLGEFIVLGDDEGYLYYCNVANFDIAQIPPGGMVSCSIDQPSVGLEVLKVFQAHRNEILRLLVFLSEGRRWILTTSSDCQVRLFTDDAQFIGYCGNKDQWSCHDPMPLKALRQVPAPILIVQSSLSVDDIVPNQERSSSRVSKTSSTQPTPHAHNLQPQPPSSTQHKSGGPDVLSYLSSENERRQPQKKIITSPLEAQNMAPWPTLERSPQDHSYFPTLSARTLKEHSDHLSLPRPAAGPQKVRLKRTFGKGLKNKRHITTVLPEPFGTAFPMLPSAQPSAKKGEELAKIQLSDEKGIKLPSLVPHLDFGSILGKHQEEYDADSELSMMEPSSLFAHAKLRQHVDDPNEETVKGSTSVRVEQWKNAKALHNKEQARTARPCHNLLVQPPDDEVRRDLTSKKHGGGHRYKAGQLEQ